MQPFQSPTIIPRTNVQFGWRNHPNFSWSQNNNDHSRSNHFQTNFPNYYHNFFNHQSNFYNYQHNFPNQAPQPSFQGPPANKKLTNLEKILASFRQNMGQALSKLEDQMSQLANFLSERPKETLPG